MSGKVFSHGLYRRKARHKIEHMEARNLTRGPGRDRRCDRAADDDAFDVLRSRSVERKVLDQLDEPTSR